MSIFRRRAREDEGAEPTENTEFTESTEDTSRDGEPPTAGALAGDPAPTGLSSRPSGPFDVTEVTDELPRVDLGALRLPGVPGMELRLEVEDGTRRVVAATVALEGSTAQLQAFAAPRTQGIWAEVRAEIVESLARSGGISQEVPGPYGTELLAQVPSRLPDGRVVASPARFVGVDGPRWFLRAVLSGPAAVDSEAAAPLEALLRGAVVVRGSEAMAPRDLLPLRLPQSGPAPSQPGQPSAAPGEST
ncbi:Protein of unknown function [Quadrisphaera granulorum]|uniref:Uncharacterized protein DUF3710 n=1 Tax=Quadrisphaera granulorum TaxID=317664 RepID=A0A316AHD5_9ACTN|nr:DUF3710 domain-containing protein [Quadrisphaera granulorum]PWJ49287.1 uncharacterized protein DUF3710 [Quadrisphaera granulorum]SZE98204.1 Protein of unknown function [Quadrisphaera granulorum]